MGFLVYKDYPKLKYPLRERDKKLKNILKKDKWIIEGVYWQTWILPAFRKAEIIIILNLGIKYY